MFNKTFISKVRTTLKPTDDELLDSDLEDLEPSEDKAITKKESGEKRKVELNIRKKNDRQFVELYLSFIHKNQEQYLHEISDCNTESNRLAEEYHSLVITLKNEAHLEPTIRHFLQN